VSTVPVNFAREIVGCGLEYTYVVKAGGIGRGFILKEVTSDGRVVDVRRTINWREMQAQEQPRKRAC
jgi:hypothetical protein